MSKFYEIVIFTAALKDYADSILDIECRKLKEIKGINKFNTSNIISMKSMFNNCNELILFFLLLKI